MAVDRWFRLIPATARKTIQSLDEIVWAINPRNDSLESFANYLSQFAQQHMTLARVRCVLDVPIVLPVMALSADARLPEWLRKEISPWGLPKDEFRDTGGWPTQLYIRAARRMVGQSVINQNFCEHPVVREDSVDLGSYSLDSHVCQRLVKDGAVIHEGGFYHRLEKPYPIPFTAIVPREDECENLLVTFCVSATHVAFASVRMEPPFMILSESAAPRGCKVASASRRCRGIRLLANPR